MLLNAYTLHDLKALTYSPPFYAVADGAAVRMCVDLVSDNTTSVGRHPADFVLFRIGRFDDSSGALLPDPVRSHVVDMISLVRVQPELPLAAQ